MNAKKYKRRHQVHSCAGKRVYDTVLEARKEASRLNTVRPHVRPCEAYYCFACTKYHVGHMSLKDTKKILGMME